MSYLDKIKDLDNAESVNESGKSNLSKFYDKFTSNSDFAKLFIEKLGFQKNLTIDTSRKELRKFMQENFIKKTSKRIIDKKAKDVFLTLVFLQDVNLSLSDFDHLGTKFSLENKKTSKVFFNKFKLKLETQNAEKNAEKKAEKKA
jgi:hypothetical protein